MTDRTLDVWCFGHKAGELSDDGERLTFAYEEDWMAAERPPLSQSLPVNGGFGPREVTAFFDGLLPEGDLRELLAARLGVSEGNAFSLLEQVGGDCAGAVSLHPPGGGPDPSGGGVDWLDDGALARLVDELPERPMYADPDGDYRLSLAGAQDKLPVVVQNGRVGLPTGGRPSTHILKTPIRGLPATILNEAMWSDVGRRLGIDCAPSRPDRIGDSEMLLVERYDREVDGSGEVVRLHQEDFSQALGIDGDHKYQREQGPGLADCFELVRRTCRTPGAELPKLLDAWALSFVAANHDAHGKNFSLLYRASGTEFAPVYDVLSTLAYRGIKPMDRKMAMHVGGEYRLEWVRRRHLERLLSDAGLGSAASRRRLRSLARRAPAAIDAAAHDRRRERWWHAHMDNVVELGHRRAKALLADIVDAAP